MAIRSKFPLNFSFVFALLTCTLLLACARQANAQSPGSASLLKTFEDTVTGLTVYQGPFSYSELSGLPGSEWLARGEKEYKPDAASMAYLQQHLKNYSLMVFLGTWCDDSRFLVPKLVKVLKTSDYPMDQVSMYGVDRAKQTLGPESKTYDVKKAPTIIVFKDGKEVGRVVETVPVSIEKSLEEILKKAGSSN
jgi:thiol-disulfide isomerase/thioredoxin